MKFFVASACTSPSGLGSLYMRSGALGWTQLNFSYTATTSSPILTFTFHSGVGAETSYLDDVSVVDQSAPMVELLNNPSFENSTLGPTGWVTWCASSCTGVGDRGVIATIGCHIGSGSNCFTDHCQTTYDYLGQSFSATIGNTYTISFWLKKTGGPLGTFYVDIN